MKYGVYHHVLCLLTFVLRANETKKGYVVVFSFPASAMDCFLGTIGWEHEAKRSLLCAANQ
jgi:hypothetical protein